MCIRLSRLLAFECTLNHCTFIHSFHVENSTFDIIMSWSSQVVSGRVIVLLVIVGLGHIGNLEGRVAEIGPVDISKLSITA